ncbi:hypothetical protein ACIHFD_56470 [Nonomuraea sp. NPDC051941]|uniref:hypothetical protein n=1 Tax=Nonomuraea sp. NPDC051941 TaxID=3364373 RepID=UPI0037CC3096
MTIQRDKQWLRNATPEQIVAAQDAGELDDLTGRSRYPSRGQLTPEHLGRMNRDEIRQAHREGRLADVLGADDAA